ncbi:MAG: aminotransferase class V-fold PLP-dependent enzyme [Myxococcota bacterium]
MRILFMCVANSARSQMAEGWVRALSQPDVTVYSAGSDPAPLRPEATAVMAEVGVDLTGQASKSSFDVSEPDVVITLCDEEVCPAYPDRVERLHWPLPDPNAVTGSRTERLDAFRTTRDQLRARIEPWLEARGLRFTADPNWANAFALQSGMAFVNHGSFGATPKVVLEAQRRLVLEFEAQPVRFMMGLGPRMDPVRERIAKVLHGHPDHLSLVENTTSGMSTVLRSINFDPGDTIVTTNAVYGGVARLLGYLADRFEVRIHTIDLPFPCPGPQAMLDALAAQWPDRARIAVFDQLASGTALVAPIAQMVAFAHARDVPVVVDAAHAPGQLAVDVDAIGADYWVGNLHKWLFAPKAVAVLYARDPASLVPLQLSHFYGQGRKAFDWIGTRDVTAWLAVEDALDFVEQLGGLDRLRVYNRDRGDRFAAIVSEQLGVPRIAPRAMTAQMETLALPREPRGDAEEWMQRLWDGHRVEAKLESIHDLLHVRLSSQIYNRDEDYDRLAKALLAEV